MFDTSSLRPYCDNLPIHASTVPLIMVTADMIESAKTVPQKRALLKKFKSCRKKNKMLISVWPGEWSSDTFVVDFDKVTERVGD